LRSGFDPKQTWGRFSPLGHGQLGTAGPRAGGQEIDAAKEIFLVALRQHKASAVGHRARIIHLVSGRSQESKHLL
jgi:hypothetical protein